MADMSSRQKLSGQLSAEFFIYYTLLSVIFMAVLVLVVNVQNSVFEESIDMDAKRVLVMSKNEIDIAVNVGEGYSHEFILPEALQGNADYSIAVVPDYQEIYISYKGKNVSLPILADSVSGSMKNGRNTIRNSGGVIALE